MNQLLVATVAAALVLFAAPGLAQDASKNYIGVIGDQFALCEAEEITDYCIGGAVFEALPAGGHGIEIVDENQVQVGGAYIGAGAPQEDFCGSTQLPASYSGGALTVWVDGPIYGSGLGVLGTTCDDVQLGTVGVVNICYNRAC